MNLTEMQHYNSAALQHFYTNKIRKNIKMNLTKMNLTKKTHYNSAALQHFYTNIK